MIIYIKEYQLFNNQDTALEYIMLCAQQSKFVFFIVFLVTFWWSLNSLLEFLLHRMPQCPNWWEMDAENIFVCLFYAETIFMEYFVCMFILTQGEQEKWALVGRNRKSEAQTKHSVKRETYKIVCFGSSRRGLKR